MSFRSKAAFAIIGLLLVIGPLLTCNGLLITSLVSASCTEISLTAPSLQCRAPVYQMLGGSALSVVALFWGMVRYRKWQSSRVSPPA